MTLSSMTGFGRAQGRLSDRFAAGVVVRSVNHRYLDVQVRLTVREEMPEVEAAVRQEIEKVVARGRVTAQIDLRRIRPSPARVMLNADALADLLEQIGALKDRFAGRDPGVGVGDLLNVPGIVGVSSEMSLLDESEIAALRELVGAASSSFAEMRREEGVKLEGQIRKDLDEIVSFVEWFEPLTEGFRKQSLERLRERMLEMLNGQAVEPDRLIQEAALLADRADVTEEVVRLRTHLESFRKRLDGGGVIGRALDFLCQELHREINTLGTKCREAGVADQVVDAKGAVERVREQVQNLE
jgi:uncharacterized protein (TIGR00255 family)